jgi:hypothetical protein
MFQRQISIYLDTWQQRGRGGGSLAAAQPRPQRQLGHGGKLGSCGGHLGSGGGSLVAARPRRRQRQHGGGGGSLAAAGSLLAAAAAWRQRGRGGSSLAAARPRQQQRSGGSSSSAATAKSKPQFRKKIPSKNGSDVELAHCSMIIIILLEYFYVRDLLYHSYAIPV